MLTLCCCLDSVAKPAAQCVKQFYVFFWSSYCLHPGDNVETTQIKYTKDFNNSPYWTNKSIRKDMKTSFNTNQTFNGVKKISPLSGIAHFDFVLNWFYRLYPCMFAEGSMSFFMIWFKHKSYQSILHWCAYSWNW